MIDAVKQNLNRDRVRFFNFLNEDRQKEMMRDVRTGLAKPQKSIPAKYFYDSCGSRLFEQITMTPEYYITRTELSILEHSAGKMVEFLSGAGGDIVELGSGPTSKIKKLLDAAYARGLDRLRYVPLDICGTCIEEVIEELPLLYPDLEVLGLRADFTAHLGMLPRGKKLLVFFGSTIGNFTEQECAGFLQKLKQAMNPDDRLLVGIDMLKPIRVMEAAYNDSEGITRRFNLNMLSHINRELKGNFDLDDFEHLAHFNPDDEQVEMHLGAKRAVSVSIPSLSMTVNLRRGETIHTEICRKFSRNRIERTFSEAGFQIEGWFTDSREWFSLVEVKTQPPDHQACAGKFPRLI